MEKLMVIRLVKTTLGVAEGEQAKQEKQQEFETFIGSLRTRANVQLNTQALDAMTVAPADAAPAASVAK